MRNKTEVQVTKRQIRKVCLQRWLPITNLWKLLWSVASTVIFLPGVAVLYVAVLARRASPRLLAYTVPVPMLFSLAWLAVVDFRFATSCWEGYHFWIPVVEYVWYIQYTIFPL